MGWNWGTIKDRDKNNYVSELKADYLNQVEEAEDIEYTHQTIRNDMNKTYQNIQNDYTGTGGIQAIRIMSEVKDLMKRKKVHTYDSAYDEVTKGLSSEQQFGIIKQIGKIEGYMEYYDYVLKQDKTYEPKTITYEKPELPEHPINEQNTAKLQWQGQNNSLIHLFRQLKNNHNKEGKPLVPNSIEEVALFLKNNFECFEDVKISTITGQLKKNTAPKKANKKIELFV